MLPTPLIWALLVLSNVVSFWGAIRWKGGVEYTGRRAGLLAMGIGGVLEIAAVLLLVLRYRGRI